MFLKPAEVSAGTNINDASNFSDQLGDRQVVRTSSGTLYAFINCGMWKSANGSTWAEQDSANKPGCWTPPQRRNSSIAIDSNNIIHIAHNSLGAEAYYLTFSTSTDTFGAAESLATADNITSITIAVDSNNKPHVTYAKSTFNGLGYDDVLVYVNKISTSFSSGVNILSYTETNSQEIIIGDLIINEDNVPELSYVVGAILLLGASVGNANNAIAFTNHTIDSNVTNGYSSIAVDNTGNTWVAYTNGAGTGVVTMSKHNDADIWSTWQSPVTNSNAVYSGGSQSTVSLAIKDNDVYVFYNPSSTTSLAYDMYNGSTWLGQTVIDTRSNSGSVIAKWSYYHNNQGASQIDYLYSDGTDVFWNKLSFQSPPAAPTLSLPAAGASGVSTLPQFQFNATDTDGDFLRYEIVVYDAICSTVVRTIDQTASQTGWSGQNTQSSTAYLSGTTATHTYQSPELSNGTIYCWKARAIDPGGSNTWSAYSDTRAFSTQNIPAYPTLFKPANGESGSSVTPRFELKDTDIDGDYLRYKIEICSTSNCSSIIRTIDQTSSQTGWAGQDQQNATAYAVSSPVDNSTLAIHFYQLPALSPNTQYWWRAYAIDPGGSNTFSGSSTIDTFTTGIQEVKVQGGIEIRGGTKIGP